MSSTKSKDNLPMNVSDIVIKFLEDSRITHVFTLSGGGIMYLLDSLGKSERISYVCNYHEQACAIAADGYSRMNGFGVCFVTFGPGAVNALSGVVGAWYDSIPLMVISGQVRSSLIADYTKVRQVGPQEGNVLEMVKPVTKYAVSIRDPKEILVELEKASYLARSGRPGPVWIELPLDIQSAEVDSEKLPHWKPHNIEEDNPSDSIDEIIRLLRTKSKRPILILGNGLRLSGTFDQAQRLVAILKIPTLIPFTGKDLIEENNKYNFGLFGTSGQRHANIILQNADLILGLGVGFSVAKTGFATDKFAVGAFKIFVDIDPGQLTEHPLKADLPITADLRRFMPALCSALEDYRSNHEKWLNLCQDWKIKYPTVNPVQKLDDSFVDAYSFMKALSDELEEGDVIVTGNGLDCVTFYQAYELKKHQRSVLNGNWGSMGWDLPSAIGAHYATGKRAFCVTGDGSLMLNCQELLTIGANRLPIKIFVFNNEGYGSIKATQKSFFNGRLVGSDSTSNVYNPDMQLLAAAFFLNFSRIESQRDMQTSIKSFIDTDGPGICEIKISPDQWISPKATSFRNDKGQLESKPLDDMFPFLPFEEIEANRRRAVQI